MADILPRFDFRVASALAQSLGPTRETQEDVALVEPDLALFAVADGMGGQADGEVAARLATDHVRGALSAPAAQAVRESYFSRPSLRTRRRVIDRLQEAVIGAHEAVIEAAGTGEHRGMGCTLDLVWLVRDRAFLAHVGDSRTYLARPTTVLQLTQDHLEGEALKACGTLRPSVRRSGPQRLISAIGGSSTPSVDTLMVDLRRGDRLLLCSDGVHGPINDEGRLSELLRGGSPDHAARALVQRAVERGRDNATALVVEIGDAIVKRASEDRGLLADDLERARQSALLSGLSLSAVLGALAAVVEIELGDGVTVPRAVASDLVAYIVLEGQVRSPDGRAMGTGAWLYPESLAGVWVDGPLPVVERGARLLRMRADDFQEVCLGTPSLGMELWRRVATQLARAIPASKTAPAGPDPP